MNAWATQNQKQSTRRCFEMAAVTTAVIGTGATLYGAKKQSDAIKDGAAAQERAGNAAIDANKEALEIARQDLQPFRDIGGEALNPLLDRVLNNNGDTIADNQARNGTRILTGATRQLGDQLNSDNSYSIDNVVNNPLFKTLLKEGTENVAASNAARGRLGSGDTLKDLTNASLSIGADLYGRELDQRNIDTNNLFTAVGVGSGLQNSGQSIRNSSNNQLFNLASLGANAASGQATNTLNTTANNGNLTTQIGNVNAASGIARANNRNNTINNLTGLAGMALMGR